MVTLHLPAVPHTITSEAYSHCAFTGKVLRFPAMMATLGADRYHIIHYGVGGSATMANEHVVLMEPDEQARLRGHDGSDATKFVGDDADRNSPLYKEFNRRLRKAMMDRYSARDIILLPFGWAHEEAVRGLAPLVESGIGYPDLVPSAEFKVFESYAWMHWHQGKANRQGRNYEWVVPNYFDPSEWTGPFGVNQNRVVFLGRIGQQKGVHTVVELARLRPDLDFVICGQGDPREFLSPEIPNLKYEPPIHGPARAAYMGTARAVLMPTLFTEPFGGVAVEAQLCGTPAITTAYGAFTETVEDEVTGFRCHTLGDFLAALDRAPTLDRSYIQRRAAHLYGYERCAQMYDRAFTMIGDLKGKGWYTPRSVFGPATVTQPQESPEEQWKRAQRFELGFHLLKGEREMEQRKRAYYASHMYLYAHDVSGKRVLDIGAGPESLMLHYDVAPGSVALDPLRFLDEDEERYAERGIARVYEAAEDWSGDGAFDEVWIYNCLQHVRDPEEILRRAMRWAPVVRLWEWVDHGTDVMHLHTLTAAGLRAPFTEAGWKAENETSARWARDGGASEPFYSAVWRKP